jgi:hypothetical protein
MVLKDDAVKLRNNLEKAKDFHFGFTRNRESFSYFPSCICCKDRLAGEILDLQNLDKIGKPGAIVTI